MKSRTTVVGLFQLLIIIIVFTLMTFSSVNAQIADSLVKVSWEYQGGSATGVYGAGTNPVGFDTIKVPFAIQDRLICFTYGDLDNDGDKDFIAGTQEGVMYYYENLGTPSAPQFGRRALSSLDTIDIAPTQNLNQVRPTLEDIDNDGDLDLFVGSRYDYSGIFKLDDIQFFENIGTASNAIFTHNTTKFPNLQFQQMAEFASITFVDIDNDGDRDLVTMGSDSMGYIKNIGTPNAPSFQRQVTAANNPFHTVRLNEFLISKPVFEDFDGDGDFDLYYGTDAGTIKYVINEGTASTPVFNPQSYDMHSALDTLDVGQFAFMDMEDIDDDGVKDMIITPFSPTEFLWWKGISSGPSIASNNVSCNGFTDGNAKVTPTGTNGAVSYLWSTGATADSISGLAAGTYTVSTTDAIETFVNLVTITEPAVLTAAAVVDSNTTCNGFSDGGATASATGGTMPYTYAWSNAATTASITGVAAANYSVTITDANGCTSTTSTAITQPAVLVAATVLDSNDAGGNSGGATASATGGTSPYTYTWSNSVTTAAITGVTAGTYTVTITDNNGCNDTASVAVASGPSVSVNIDSNITCNGFSNGGATASVNGGTMPYTYAWSNSATTASITGVVAGTYSVTLTDNNGLTATNSGTITEPASMTAAIVVDANTSCNGASDGGATASATGGTAPYTYNWSNSATTAGITGVVAGTYSVTITDANGCSDTSSAAITQPAALVASTTLDANDSGGGNGAATASATGGSMPYTYTWSNSATTASITSLTAGTYTVTVSDVNACSDTSSVVIAAGPSVSATTDSTVSCNGFSDGGASASVSGGTMPFTYAWSNTATTASITGVTAGVYTVTVTDNNGLTASNSATISQPSALAATSTVNSQVSCNGGTDGSISTNGTGGTGSYTYTWSNSATTATASTLAAGTYTVTISDANGCTTTVSESVTEPAATIPTITLDSNDMGNGGGATASATGGTAPYTYNWSNSATTASITGVMAGTYTVSVTDNNACSSTPQMITITAGPIITMQTDSNVSCNGLTDGGATANVSAGNPPYTYAWSNTATTASITGVAAGTYTITVTDNIGLTETDMVTITEPNALVAGTVVDSNLTCKNENNGGATASATGGTMPYTYNWSNTATTASITGVAAGIYTVTVTDANGCSSNSSSTITEPDSIVFNLIQQLNVSCNGGSDGGFIYSISGGTSDINGTDTNYFVSSNLGAGPVTIRDTARFIPAGPFIFIVGDNNGCESDTIRMTILEPAALVASNSVDSNVSCNGFTNGGASASATGGTAPYTYAWSNSATTASITGVAAGSYTVTITDANGCTDNSTLSITEPAVLAAVTAIDSNVTCNTFSDGGATASATGGTMPYTYLWNNTATTASITGVVAGTYTVIITDANGCTSMSSSTVTEPAALIAATVVDSNVTCKSGVNGGASASATGGTMPYTYTWSNSATTASIVGVAAGTYTVTVTDANACTSISSTMITEPDSVVFTLLETFQPSCNGFSDGGFSYLITGGTPTIIGTDTTYVVSISAQQVLNRDTVPTGAGLYEFLVGDANGCISDTVRFTITEPTVLMAATSVDSNVSCNAFTDGGATASASGGTAPYTYAWSNSATTAGITGVTAGSYTVTVTDANGCTENSTVSITEPAVLIAVTAIDSNVTCNTFSDGGATASATGGTMPYSYLWNNTATTASITGVTAGTYTVTITDANGCTSTSSSTVTEPAALIAATVVDSNVTCNTFSDGGASASATGGTMPYTYSWSNSATTASITGVAAGTYTVTISDSNGCTSTSSTTITEPNTLVAATAVDSNATCLGFTDGGATASATGGTMPYTYTWSNAATTASITGIANGTYTVTITDANACTTTSSTSVIVVDTVKPTVLTQNVTVYLDASGAASITTADIDNGTNDACGAPSLSLDSTNFDCSEVGANTVQLRATDVNSNVDSATAIVTVLDTLNPLVSTQDVTVYLDANGQVSITTMGINNGSTDNCSIMSMSLDSTAFDCSEVGANTVTLTVTDVNNNVDSATAVVTVIDSIKPTIITQNINVYLDANGQASITVADVDNGSSDNCNGGGFASLDSSNFDCSEIGANTVQLRAIDVNNNIDSASAIVTVLDTLNPIVLTQNVTVYLDANGVASITTMDINNGSSDNCSIQSMSLDSTSFDCMEVGANTVTLTIIDVNSNVDSATAIVTVLDTLNPIVTTQDVTVYLDANGQASITTMDINNGSSDNCSIQMMSLDSVSFDCSEVGANTVTLTVTDANNNVDSATAVVTVIDSIKPTVLTQDITVYLDANGQATITEAMIDNGTNDNCAIQIGLLDSTNFDCNEVGANTVYLRVQDVNGNIDSAAATVTVLDTINPLISGCPSNINQMIDAGNCTAVVTWTAPTAADNCAVDSLVASHNPGDVFPLGTTVVTYIAYDPELNTDTCIFTVTITDSEDPVIANIPMNIVMDNDSSVCGAVVTWDAVTASDNCQLDSLRSNFSSGMNFPIGTTTVTFTAYDASMNTSSASFTVTVNDTTKPVIVCPSDIAQCDSIVSFADATATDNCTGFNIVRTDATGLNSGDLFPVGMTTLSYLVTDASNNQATCDVNIEVYTPPTANAGEDVTTRDIEPVQLLASSTNAASFRWRPSFSVAIDTVEQPLVNPQSTTTYTMEVTSPEGCVVTDEVEVVVNVVNKLDATTLFSPNGDGMNDTWVVNKPELIDGCKLIIVNRNGSEVYSTNQYNNEWDGTINGTQLPEGTYYYIFDCSDGRSLNGPITILREKR